MTVELNIDDMPSICENLYYSNEYPKKDLPDFELLHHYFRIKDDFSILALDHVKKAYIKHIMRTDIIEPTLLSQQISNYLMEEGIKIVNAETVEERANSSETFKDDLLDIQDMNALRIEALKLAYDTSHKLGGFSTMRIYNMDNSSESLERDIEDVFKLADINMNYLCIKNKKQNRDK